jgi:hypothetical protein
MSGVNRRKTIRAAVVQAIKDAAIDGIGDRVYGNRVRRIWASKVPCILVYTRTEGGEPDSITPNGYLRRLSLAVEVIWKANAELDDRLDEVAEAIEAVISTSEDESLPLGGAVADIEYRGTELDLSRDAEDQLGAARLLYEAKYFT